MVDTVKLPGVGSVSKNTAYGIGIAAVAIVGVGYYRHKKAAAATPATTDAQVDPATGYTYGSPEDAAALANNSAYSNPLDLGGGGGPIGNGSGGNAGGVPGGVYYANNAQWEQAAISYLVDTVGLPSTAVSSALGKFLAGAACDPAEQSIIHQAIAAENQPPVAGPNGYPPSIRTAAAAPPPMGKKQLGFPEIHVVKKTATGAQIAWTKVPNAVTYRVTQPGHRIVSNGSVLTTVTLPHGTYQVIARNPYGPWIDSQAATITI